MITVIETTESENFDDLDFMTKGSLASISISCCCCSCCI